MQRLMMWVSMLFGLWIGSLITGERYDYSAAFWIGATLLLVWWSDRRERR